MLGSAAVFNLIFSANSRLRPKGIYPCSITPSNLLPANCLYMKQSFFNRARPQAIFCHRWVRPTASKTSLLTESTQIDKLKYAKTH